MCFVCDLSTMNIVSARTNLEPCRASPFRLAPHSSHVAEHKIQYKLQVRHDPTFQNAHHETPCNLEQRFRQLVQLGAVACVTSGRSYGQVALASQRVEKLASAIGILGGLPKSALPVVYLWILVALVG